MRIQPSKDLNQEHIDNSVRGNLSGGYNRGLWNPDVGAVFLVAEDNTVTTVIPEDDIGLDEDMDQCRKCDAMIMQDCQLDNCRWCKTEDYEEQVSSVPFG